MYQKWEITIKYVAQIGKFKSLTRASVAEIMEKMGNICLVEKYWYNLFGK